MFDEVITRPEKNLDLSVNFKLIVFELAVSDL